MSIRESKWRQITNNLLGKKQMSGHRRQRIDSTAFDSLLTMSSSTIKLVLIKKKIIFWSAEKFNTNVGRSN
jgi:hypothetical protein